jgi:hypothetical protein
LDSRKSTADVESVLAGWYILTRITEIVVHVLTEYGAAARISLFELGSQVRLRRLRDRIFGGNPDGFRLRRNFGLEEKLGSFNSQPDGQRFLDRHSVDSVPIEENSVAAVTVVNPPSAVFEPYFGVHSADIVILNAEFALVHTTNAERFREQSEMWTYAFCGKGYL